MLLDAVVTAKNGAYVRDLTQKDFRIWEDNKEQTIKSFAFESSPGASQPHSLVLFFDQSSMEASDQIPVLQSASRFIDAETGPNRKMAIVSYEGVLHLLQNFTDNAGRLKKALPGPASRVTGAEQARGGSFMRPLATADTENTVRGAIPGGIDDTGSRNMLQSLRYLATNLAVLPGRKIVVVFAWRIPSSPSQRSDLKEVVDACNKSGVAVYPIDVRPVSVASTETPFPSFGRGRAEPGSDLGPADSSAGCDQQLLSDLAGRTGGFVIRNANDLLGGLQAVAGEQDQYYALTFTPPESKEGTCHTLRVKVDRTETTVRARNSYCTAKAPDLLAGSNMGRDLEKRAAETQAGKRRRTGRRVRCARSISYDGLDPASLVLCRAQQGARSSCGGDHAGRAGNSNVSKAGFMLEINLLGMASTGDGGVPARFSDNLKFDFDNEAQVDAWKMKPLHYEKEFRIAPGQYKFTLAFGEAGESDATSLERSKLPLMIDPLERLATRHEWTGAQPRNASWADRSRSESLDR